MNFICFPLSTVKVPVPGVGFIIIYGLAAVTETEPPPEAEIFNGLPEVPEPVIVTLVPAVTRPFIVVTVPAVNPAAVPVKLVAMPLAGVPRAGVTKVGELENTAFPVPVDVVRAVKRLALEGVPRNVAIPVPRPLIPVLTGKPVAFVSVPEAGVPSAGVTNVLLVRVCVSVVPTIRPLAGNVWPVTEVAARVPEPEVANDAPVPTTIAAVVFVLLVKALNADDPPPEY